jgi:RNA-binding protein YhbY
MKTLIDLLLESELAEMNDKETVDEIGKFFIVKKPKKGMTKEDIMCEDDCI